MNINEAVLSRHTVKAYEGGHTLPQEQIDSLLTLLRNSPSSVNSQPWHFVVASTAEGRETIGRAATGSFAYNHSKIIDASHVVALCMQADMSEEHLSAVLAQEEADGRFKIEGARESQEKSRRSYVDMHRYVLRDVPQWMEKQVYLALGGLLLGAAMLGIDATPMEGFDTVALDKELKLRERRLTSVVLVALGRRSDKDFNATLPKSRLPNEAIFTFI